MTPDELRGAANVLLEHADVEDIVNAAIALTRAADAIEEMDADLDRFKGEATPFDVGFDSGWEARDARARNELAALRAENAKLRERLDNPEKEPGQ